MTSINLSWTAPQEANEKIRYNHTIAETPFGRFVLTWKGWKDYPIYGFDETPWDGVEYHGWMSVGEAQQWAEQEMYKRIQLLVKPHPQCDEACIYLCTKAGTQAPECASKEEPATSLLCANNCILGETSGDVT
jgi:hypothetical protein